MDWKGSKIHFFLVVFNTIYTIYIYTIYVQHIHNVQEANGRTRQMHETGSEIHILLVVYPLCLTLLNTVDTQYILVLDTFRISSAERVRPVPIYCRYISQRYMKSQFRYIADIFHKDIHRANPDILLLYFKTSKTW